MWHRTFVAFMKKKTETLGKSNRYKDAVTRYHSKRIRTVLDDCAGLADDIKKAVTVKFFTIYIRLKCKDRIRIHTE